MTASTKDLIERARAMGADTIGPELADALERLIAERDAAELAAAAEAKRVDKLFKERNVLQEHAAKNQALLDHGGYEFGVTSLKEKAE